MTQNTKTKVLITGASGLIGKLTLAGLSDKYTFSALNRSKIEGLPCLQADIADLAAIRPAFNDIDMVLHLSAETKLTFDWDATMSTTVLGALNMYRAAADAGIKRVVFMSTGSTMLGHEWDDTLPYGKLARGEYDQVSTPWQMKKHTDPPRPDSPYGVGKLFGEQAGRWFADNYPMSVLCIRLGAVLDNDKPKLLRHFPGYLAQQDALQMIDLCLSAPSDLHYDIFDAISNNKYRWRDTTHAKNILSWSPTGSSDNFNPDEYR